MSVYRFYCNELGLNLDPAMAISKQGEPSYAKFKRECERIMGDLILKNRVREGESFSFELFADGSVENIMDAKFTVKTKLAAVCETEG